MPKKKLIVVVGPTAIGKTALSIKLAKHLQTEIISADSRQFYKEMTIGTAVPSAEELKQVPHHFIQHLSVEQNYSVGDYEQEALHEINRLFRHYDHLILTGGSGLYLDAVTKGLDHFPKIDSNIRKNWIRKFETQGIEILQRELKKFDPDYYAKVDLQNPHRLIRALEVSEGTGKPYSSFRRSKPAERAFDSIFIGLHSERTLLYERINQRVDLMLDQGLLGEAESLFSRRELNALQTVGYRELFSYLEGKTDLETAVEQIKKNTRRYAKRQLTWFRKNKDISWFDYREDLQNHLDHLRPLLNERL